MPVLLQFNDRGSEMELPLKPRELKNREMVLPRRDWNRAGWDPWASMKRAGWELRAVIVRTILCKFRGGFGFTTYAG